MTPAEAGKLGYEKSREKLVSRSKEISASAKSTYELAPKTCKACGKAIPYIKRKNRYCGHSCSARATNKGRAKAKTCKRCDKPVTRRVYCSACWGLPGTNNQPAPFDKCTTDQTRRQALLRERGHKCEECKRTKWQGKPIPIQMDHIDGNSDNSARENLRLICPNCHALTPTYGARNKNNSNSRRNVERRRRYHGYAPNA